MQNPSTQKLPVQSTTKLLFITSYVSWHVCSKTSPPLARNVQIWKNSPTNMSFLRLMCSRCGSIPLLGEKWPERSHPGNKFGWPSSGHLWGLKRLMPCVEVDTVYHISMYEYSVCIQTVYTGKDFIDYIIQPEPIANYQNSLLYRGDLFLYCGIPTTYLLNTSSLTKNMELHPEMSHLPRKEYHQFDDASTSGDSRVWPSNGLGSDGFDV